MNDTHSFHIPVMGIGFSLETPLKVAHYGMDSVISIGDDILLEKLRKMYCEKEGLPYQEITDETNDYRAKRITSFLNLIYDLAVKKFEALKNAAIDKSQELREYFHLLPDSSSLKQEFQKLTAQTHIWEQVRSWAKDHLSMGSIDVNIMTKVDKDNYRKDEKLPVEYNDAHAGLRGYMNSNLNSSIVFSAGMNPRLYAYLETFDALYPDQNGELKKKIILKVSDYRSALIQGKFLAKKGLWVSEYRIESGLNCGGHAFATDGYLMGPILAEFRDKREELVQSVHEIFTKALADKNRPLPSSVLPLKITAQGGVGTAEEHQFLIDHYGVDSVGWGTPFLLVPEATTVDHATLNKLVAAKEEDLYLSNISPLGVPFHSLRGNTKDLEKRSHVEKGRAGSACPKRFLALSNEFTEKSLCTASRQYQHLKIQELDKAGLSPEAYKIQFDKITEKSCICVGLGTTVLLAHNLDTKVEGNGVSICPGPNLAYFSRIMSLREITDHIYGRFNVITRTDRPNMFVKELTIYLDYLKNKLEESRVSMTQKQQKYLQTFAGNLKEGIDYYHDLFSNLKGVFEDTRGSVLKQLDACKRSLGFMGVEIDRIMD